MEIDLQKLTRDQAAQLLDVTPKTLENYTKQKEDPLRRHENPGSFPFYIWGEVLAWRIRREARKAPAKVISDKENLLAARLEGQNRKNEIDAMAIAVRKGELLESQDVRLVWSQALVDIKQAMRNVGHVASTDIVDGMSYAQKKKVIDALVFANLNQVISQVKTEGTHEG